nr:hypothetical protein [Colwellia sp. TT2012]
MSTFIDLLRQHHQALEIQYSAKLSHDMRKAIYAMLLCKTVQQRQSLWVCNMCYPKDYSGCVIMGLLSSGAKKLRVIIQLLLLPVHDWLKFTKETTTIRASRICPCCQHEMHCTGVTRTP